MTSPVDSPIKGGVAGRTGPSPALVRFPSFTGAIRAPICSLSAHLRRPASKTAGCGQRWPTKAFAIGIYAAATEPLERTMIEPTIAVRGGRCKFCKSASGLHAHLLSSVADAQRWRRGID